MEWEEAELDRAKKKDLIAFEAIVRRYQSMVYSIAYHFLHDRSTAEELAQDVFLQLFRDVEKVESPRHLRFWLRRVACHRSIDHYRRRSIFRKVGLEEAERLPAQNHPGDPMLARRLSRLVAALPEIPRMVLTLRFQEDLLPAEIAEIMEVPLNTVKSQLARALALLQEKMNGRERVA